MKFTLFSFLFAGAVLALPAHAQRTDEQPPPGDARASQDATIRHTLVQKIEQLKYNKIKTTLELDDATTAKFFAIYKPAEKDIQSLVKERNFELKALGAATNASSTNPAEIAAMTQKIRELNQQIATREQTLDGDLTPLLTPLQRAKLLVFEHEFNQRVREQLAQRKGTIAELRALRQQLRQQRIKNQLLKKLAAQKAGLR
jgi:Spy/CpxP family protein refolding chaperone